MKIWNIKYALTKGIEELEGDYSEPNSRYVRGECESGYSFFLSLGTDAFLTAEEARIAALEKVVRGYASLEKKRKKLDKMKALYSGAEATFSRAYLKGQRLSLDASGLGTITTGADR